MLPPVPSITGSEVSVSETGEIINICDFRSGLSLCTLTVCSYSLSYNACIKAGLFIKLQYEAQGNKIDAALSVHAHMHVVLRTQSGCQICTV